MEVCEFEEAEDPSLNLLKSKKVKKNRVSQMKNPQVLITDEYALYHEDPSSFHKKNVETEWQ